MRLAQGVTTPQHCACPVGANGATWLEPPNAAVLLRLAANGATSARESKWYAQPSEASSNDADASEASWNDAHPSEASWNDAHPSEASWNDAHPSEASKLEAPPRVSVPDDYRR